MVLLHMGVGSKVKNIVSSSLGQINANQMFTALAVIIASIGFWEVKTEFEKHCYIRPGSTIFKNMSVFSLIYINTKNIPIALVFTLLYNTVRVLVACKNPAGDSDLVESIKKLIDKDRRDTAAALANN